MAILGSTALLQAEIDAGVELFKLLKPEAQKGFIALFHAFHHKQQISAAQFLAQAQRARDIQPGTPTAPAAPSAAKDLSSTSLNPDLPPTG